MSDPRNPDAATSAPQEPAAQSPVPAAEPAQAPVESSATPPVERSEPAAVEPPETVAPTPDVDLAEEASPLPGAHRGGFSRLPTAPVPLTQRNDAPVVDADVRWAAPAPAPARGIAAWALGFSIVGLIVSLFVGWGFPIGIVGIVSALVALRRPLESRAIAVWAIVLGAVSLLYSAGWLVWAATRTDIAV